MDEQIFLDRLVRRYLNSDATMAELKVFLLLLEEGKLDETLSRIIESEISAGQETGAKE